MPNNKNILREKINEACPELLKLEFGCEFKCKWYGEGCGSSIDDIASGEEIIVWNTDETQMSCGMGDFSIIDFVELEDGTWNSDLEMHLEILGKPPTLEHLLRTIGNMMIVCDMWGNFYQLEMKLSDKKPKFGEVLFKYDLTKPPLEQSEEVIEALLKIINA